MLAAYQQFFETVDKLGQSTCGKSTRLIHTVISTSQFNLISHLQIFLHEAALCCKHCCLNDSLKEWDSETLGKTLELMQILSRSCQIFQSLPRWLRPLHCTVLQVTCLHTWPLRDPMSLSSPSPGQIVPIKPWTCCCIRLI